MKLASLEKILEIRDIPNADFIQMAKVLGYQTVVKKGEFQVGDLCVWINPDTTVQRAPWNSFLWPKDDQDPQGKPIRLRVMKFRGQVSQGLALPVNIIPDPSLIHENNLGFELTEVVGVEKYEKPLPIELSGEAVGYFPSFIPRTDEENLRSNPEALTELKNYNGILSITQKIDGTSGTLFEHEGHVGVCSRNTEWKESTNNVYWRMYRKYDFARIFEAQKSIAIQGEVFGEGIQKNPLDVKGINFAVFDVWDIKNQRYFEYPELHVFCKRWKLPMVSLVPRMNYETFMPKGYLTMDRLVKLANEQRYLNDAFCEGIVIRPWQNTYSEVLNGRLSVKVISEKYALKHGE